MKRALLSDPASDTRLIRAICRKIHAQNRRWPQGERYLEQHTVPGSYPENVLWVKAELNSAARTRSKGLASPVR